MSERALEIVLCGGVLAAGVTTALHCYQKATLAEEEAHSQPNPAEDNTPSTLSNSLSHKASKTRGNLGLKPVTVQPPVSPSDPAYYRTESWTRERQHIALLLVDLQPAYWEACEATFPHVKPNSIDLLERARLCLAPHQIIHSKRATCSV